MQFRVLWQLVQGLLHSVSLLSRKRNQDESSKMWCQDEGLKSKGRFGVFFYVLKLESFSSFPPNLVTLLN